MTLASGPVPADERQIPLGLVVKRTILTVVGLTGTVAGLTGLYLGMRAVMDVGGACAEGGPYVIEQQCPEGVAALMPLSIFGGLLALGIYLFGVRGFPGPHLALLAWPALFLSLGWNFLEFGLDPPGEQSGLEWGWLICAITFGLMGGLPLLALPSAWRQVFWSDGETDDASSGGGFTQRLVGAGPRPMTGATIGPGLLAQPGPTTGVGAPTFPTGTGTVNPTAHDSVDTFDSHEPVDDESGGMVEQLERLATLHRRGDLDADEYETAKRAVLEGER